MSNAVTSPRSTPADARRSALAAALAFTVYGGLFVLLVGWVSFGRLFVSTLACLAGYAAAVALHAAAHGAVRLLAKQGWRGSSLAGSLPSVFGLPAALAWALTADVLPRFAGGAAFAGASLSLIISDEFPVRLRNLLLPPERVRESLACRPELRALLLRSIKPLMIAGNAVPWIAAAAALATMPPDLRARVGGFVLILAYLARLLIVQVLEEIVVWGFTQSIYAGDFEAAARLPLGLARLREEIEQAPRDLECPLAAYVAHGLNGPEGFPFSREQMEDLVAAYVRSRGAGFPACPDVPPSPLADRTLERTTSPAASVPVAETGEPSVLRKLIEHGARFTLAADAADPESLDPPLPRLGELRQPAARAALARRFSDEPLTRVIGRRYQREVRGLLFPFGLLWLPLPVVAWLLRDTPFWPVPLLLAACSLSLMLWVVFYYDQWAFDESLRARDFDYLASQLGKGVMFGELEEALGSRSPLVRDRAIELMLFHDGIVSQGITVPAPALRKFLKRA